MILVHHVRSLSKQVDDIGFTVTQISTSHSTCKIIESLNFFNISFNNNENEFLNAAYGCRTDIAVFDKCNPNKVSIFSFNKQTFSSRVFTPMKTILRDARILSVNVIITSSKS